MYIMTMSGVGQRKQIRKCPIDRWPLKDSEQVGFLECIVCGEKFREEDTVLGPEEIMHTEMIHEDIRLYDEEDI